MALTAVHEWDVAGWRKGHPLLYTVLGPGGAPDNLLLNFSGRSWRLGRVDGGDVATGTLC